MKISKYEEDYMLLVADILHKGIKRQTRNAVTKSVFGRIFRVKPEKNRFPILSGRKMFYKGVVGELAAILKGPKHLDDFKKMGCNYWDKWANADGSIKVDYGNAWLDFNGVNQIDEVVKSIKNDPYGRRHIITGWRPDTIPGLNLPCCHLLYQWYVRDGELDMIWYQRSVDTMIGLPSDVILAYVWNLLMANETGLKPGELIFMLGDTHIYASHFNDAREYLSRQFRMTPGEDALPEHSICNQTTKNFNPFEFEIKNYNHFSKIDFELIA